MGPNWPKSRILPDLLIWSLLKGFCQYQNRSDFFGKKIGFDRRFVRGAEWVQRYSRTAILLKIYMYFFYFELRHFVRSIWAPFRRWNFEKMPERGDLFSKVSGAIEVVTPGFCLIYTSLESTFFILRSGQYFPRYRWFWAQEFGDYNSGYAAGHEQISKKNYPGQSMIFDNHA